MWQRLSQAEIEEMLTNLISRHRKNQFLGFCGGSVVMLGLAIVLNMYFFVPLSPYLSPNIPVENEMGLRILLLFAALEILMLALFLFDARRFHKMNNDDRKEYLLDNLRKKSTKICPSCWLFHNHDEVYCKECGHWLVLSYEYRWVEDGVKESK